MCVCQVTNAGSKQDGAVYLQDTYSALVCYPDTIFVRYRLVAIYQNTHFRLLQTPCCRKVYTCRQCHDGVEDHKLDRKKVEVLRCNNCETLQAVHLHKQTIHITGRFKPYVAFRLFLCFF